MIQTDIAIIGAGPVGLFAVFEAGLLKLRCHLIDYLPIPGGQCAEVYPKKPIYDIPGYPSVLAGELIDNLMKQIEPFSPSFTLGERAEQIRQTEGGFVVTTSRGTEVECKAIAIAGGLGCFEPRKPSISNLADYEDKGVDYIIRNPEAYRGKKVVVAGGGDSALDWTIVLADIAAELTLVHRRKEFRGAPDSVEKVMKLVAEGRMTLLTDAEVAELHGDGHLQKVVINIDGQEPVERVADHFIPLFGLSPKLGPIADWGLALTRNAIDIDPTTTATSVDGVYAIGDISNYPGKLKLILCGFHEGAMMAHAIYKKLNPDKRLVMKYTTVTGIEGM